MKIIRTPHGQLEAIGLPLTHLPTAQTYLSKRSLYSWTNS